jgi:hypothetical protein
VNCLSNDAGHTPAQASTLGVASELKGVGLRFFDPVILRFSSLAYGESQRLETTLAAWLSSKIVSFS